MSEPTWTTVCLAAVNAAQLVLLAWIASRGTRRRRSDARAAGQALESDQESTSDEVE